ncbi:hypothetical protein ACTXT7_016900, partial [Hymenolepis weldensis]
PSPPPPPPLALLLCWTIVDSARLLPELLARHVITGEEVRKIQRATSKYEESFFTWFMGWGCTKLSRWVSRVPKIGFHDPSLGLQRMFVNEEGLVLPPHFLYHVDRPKSEGVCSADSIVDFSGQRRSEINVRLVHCRKYSKRFGN